MVRKANEHDRVIVFAEARIPRPLYYPDLSSPAERVQLEVREYCDRENGQSNVVSFCRPEGCGGASMNPYDFVRIDWTRPQSVALLSGIIK